MDARVLFSRAGRVYQTLPRLHRCVAALTRRLHAGGFETITLVQEGTCDHTDSLGAAGRYGGDGHAGDLQWMTAGAGCVHGEVFPLVHTTKPNTLRLFQIWLNLPVRFCEGSGATLHAC